MSRDIVREANERLEGVAIVTEMLNGFRQGLIDAGRDKERAEIATMMRLNSFSGKEGQ